MPEAASAVGQAGAHGRGVRYGVSVGLVEDKVSLVQGPEDVGGQGGCDAEEVQVFLDLERGLHLELLHGQPVGEDEVELAQVVVSE